MLQSIVKSSIIEENGSARELHEGQKGRYEKSYESKIRTTFPNDTNSVYDQSENKVQIE